jgi:Tfp pilus assembly protein PilX
MRVLENEKGSALMLGMLMILLLSVIGVLSVQTSITETRIAGNDRLYRAVFHEAEGGVEVGKELLEQSIEDRNSSEKSTRRNVKIVCGGFLTKAPLGLTDYPSDPDPVTHVSDNRRDAYFPTKNPDGSPCSDSQPHTNLRMGSSPQPATGSALAFGVGYEGKGRGSAGGGTWIVYDIRSQHQNVSNTKARIWARWRHAM